MAGSSGETVRMRGAALAVAAVLAAMLLWALSESNPYGYYQLLRWACLVGFLFIARFCHLRSDESWVWAFCALGLLYNPVIPFPLGRSLWEVVNIGSALVLAIWVAKEVKAKGGLPRP